jgi:hypothetical protein
MNALVASGLTAAVMSERVRGVLRRGAVFGLAGAMSAAEAVAAGARSAAQGAEFVASSAGDMAGDLVGEAKATRGGDRSAGTTQRRGAGGTTARQRMAPA